MSNLKYIYSIIFLSLSGWVIYAYFTTTEIIHSQEKYAYVINISGKQRMLSQKTILVAKRYYETDNQEFKKHLIELYNNMLNEHREIISNYLMTEEISAIYQRPPVSLDKKIESYLQVLYSFIQSKDIKTLQEIESLSFELLPLINNAVYLFEIESNKKTEALMERELFILIGTLLTLILEAVVIVIPAIRIATRKNSELHQLIEERTYELEKLSVTDQLTKLYNRRKIDEMMKSELDQAVRYSYSFSLILIDIDYFKDVNDSYGHQVGDEVLQAISRLLLSNIRKSDMLGRWGGEEFLIISLEKDFQKVLIFAEKLRALVENHQFGTAGNISCSFGVTNFAPGDTADSLLLRADVALYDAKHHGRNCVKSKNINNLSDVKKTGL